MTDEFGKNVKFSGNLSARDDMLQLIDEVMKKQGTIDGLGDVSDGLAGLPAENTISIIDEDDSLAVVVTITETESEIGRFVVDKKTRTVYQAANQTDEEETVDEDMDFLDEI
jgi:GH35 family endo-1,4-beta-xylanase